MKKLYKKLKEKGIVTYNGNTQEIKKVLDEDIGKNKYILKYGR